MKPFDLEAAARGEPLVTRGGQTAHFIAHVPELDESVCVICRVEKTLLAAYENGRSYDVGESKYDLFMAPKKRTVWVNMYPGGYTRWHDTEAQADEDAGIQRIGNRAWPLEIEE